MLIEADRDTGATGAISRFNEATATYRAYRDRYRDTATSLGFEGHMKWAEAMP